MAIKANQFHLSLLTRSRLAQPYSPQIKKPLRFKNSPLFRLVPSQSRRPLDWWWSRGYRQRCRHRHLRPRRRCCCPPRRRPVRECWNTSSRCPSTSSSSSRTLSRQQCPHRPCLPLPSCDETFSCFSSAEFAVRCSK